MRPLSQATGQFGWENERAPTIGAGRPLEVSLVALSEEILMTGEDKHLPPSRAELGLNARTYVFQ